MALTAQVFRHMASLMALVTGFACASARSVRGGTSKHAETAQTVRPSNLPCSLGSISTNAPRVEIADVLADPDQFYGRQVVVRGYLILGRETTALVEPRGKRTRLPLSVKRIPASTPEDILPCRMRVVDVLGHITHVPTRGGETPIIFGEAMASANR